MSIRVYLELGARRVFACALDWPGWCRSARDEDAALDTLAVYAPRYAAVAAAAGVKLPGQPALEVIERIPGDGTTDFGAPNRVLDLDQAPLASDDADRLTRLVHAAWEVFDSAVAGAPAVLPKGPRGGGRDRDGIVQHVLAAETAYARKIGVRFREPRAGELPAVTAARGAVAEALQADNIPERGWPVPYACRRIAWHILDHAWELQDKSASA